MQYSLDLVRHGPDMPNPLQNNKATISLARVESFCFFIACSYTSIEATLRCYHVVLGGYCPTCRKLSKKTNCQCLKKGLRHFVDFLRIVIYILLYIHWSYFGLAVSDIGSQSIRLSDVLNLKSLKNILRIKLIFCFHWSYRTYHAILGYDSKIFLAYEFSEFFNFDLLDLLILIPEVHCYIVLVSFLSGGFLHYRGLDKCGLTAQCCLQFFTR